MYRLSAKVGTRAAHCCPIIKPLQKRAASCYNRRLARERQERRAVKERNLGRSGLRVSLVGLGCNNFGGRIDFEATKKVVHKALDLGITFFDEADNLWRPARQFRDMSRADPRRSAQGHRAGDQIRPTDGCRRPFPGSFAALHHGRGRGEPEAAKD